jgi:hypothetical protein
MNYQPLQKQKPIQMNRRSALHSFTKTALFCGAGGLVTAAKPQQSQNSDFAFVLIGDTPYSALDEFSAAKVLQEASVGASFTIHVGDIKSGRESCSDTLLSRRLKLLDTSPIPLIYLPGDNEWVDCRRTEDSPFDAANRLQFIRREAFGTQYSFGTKKLTTQGQTDFPEHRQWSFQGIQFISLNVPGSFNGIGVLPQAAIDARMLAVQAWLEAGVTKAIQSNQRGLVVALHANIGVDSSGFSPLKGKRAQAYQEFREFLLGQFKRWEKPCLLLHGDSHAFSNDKPSDDLPKLQRVESFGFPFTSAWARISVVNQNPALFVVSANHL